MTQKEMNKTIELSEQQVLNLHDWLQQEVEKRFISETSRAIMLQIITKLEEE